jgi:hypothetical protein
MEFCEKNGAFDFLISLDGDDAKTVGFCRKYNIPIMYSFEREGVGLSKNRVFESYPDYSFYFFIEDDVVLINPSVFQIHIDAANESGIPHFSLFARDRIRDQVNSSTVKSLTVLHAWYGGAPFNFFTRAGINKVGGFDLYFAKLKRFGHTEHSYRFVNAGLCQYPFNILEQCIEGFLEWTEPGTVTKIKVEKTENRLFVGEESLIAEKNKWQPVATLSEYVKPESLDLKLARKSRLRFFYKARYIIRVSFFDQIRRIRKNFRKINKIFP